MSAVVFDRVLARRRLGRALSRAEGYPSFLLERAAGDLDERLQAVLRRFPLALDLGSSLPLAGPVLGTRCDAVIWAPEIAQPGAAIACDAEALPLGEGRLDLVTSLLALQGVNDLPGALVQIRRALKPDGLFIGCLLGGRTLSELRQCLLEAEVELTGGASPRVAPFAELRDCGSLLQRAGFALPVVDSELVTVRYRDAFGLLADLRALGWANALADRSRKPLRRGMLLRAAALYGERFADADGRVRASFEMVWLSGWAPHESQQKPLRPGSAKARLADALGVKEEKG